MKKNEKQKKNFTQSSSRSFVWNFPTMIFKDSFPFKKNFELKKKRRGPKKKKAYISKILVD